MSEVSSLHTQYLDSCCEALRLELHELLGKGRAVERVVLSRQAITWAMKDRFPSLSWPQLGRLLLRDHSTAMYSAAKFARALESGARWAIEMRAALQGYVAPLADLESPLDSLQRFAAEGMAAE
ncbi:MAG TPA: hypothetical protein VER96_36975 [Polyangiaceae bacterium]|nr:hypothetical protein [Polyangiaceae bacterium]